MKLVDKNDPDLRRDCKRLRELEDPRDMREARHILKLIEAAIPAGTQSGVLQRKLNPAKGRRRHKRLMYNAIGMELWKRFVQTGRINKVWWDIFHRAVYNRKLATSAMMSIDGKMYFPFTELHREIHDALTDRKRVAILRSIAPKSEKVRMRKAS